MMRPFQQIDVSRVEWQQMSIDGGIAVVRSPIDRACMAVIASVGAGWDHVSVSRKNRVPNWAEMEHVKRLFFNDDETAVQFHVPSEAHISFHEFVLHLWRPQDVALPRPPGVLVGPQCKVAPKNLAEATQMMREAGLL